MKNENIINALNKLEPSKETQAEILNNIMRRQNRRRRIFKPQGLIAMAAAIALMVGVINIQTVVAFFSGLFFAPGVGLTDSPVIHYGMDGPIDIETEHGLLTLQFANRITKDGRTHLFLYMQPSGEALRGDSLYISINAGGEYIVSDEKIQSSRTQRADGSEYVIYQYFYENFPKVNAFILTVAGAETHISLTSQPGNSVLSEEINGITVAAKKFAGVTDLIAIGVFDSSESAADYMIHGHAWVPRVYCKDGEAIFMSGVQGRFSVFDPLNYSIMEFNGNDREIKSVPADAVNLLYLRKQALPVELPVPKDGEAIQANIEIAIGSHTFKITEVRRDGDVIYYEDNAVYFGLEDREQAVISRESIIRDTFFSLFSEWNETVMEKLEAANREKISLPQMRGGQIRNFDETAETLTFYFTGADVTQFGDFTMTFD